MPGNRISVGEVDKGVAIHDRHEAAGVVAPGIVKVRARKRTRKTANPNRTGNPASQRQKARNLLPMREQPTGLRVRVRATDRVAVVSAEDEVVVEGARREHRKLRTRARSSKRKALKTPMARQLRRAR
jgi:hypothetical protein